MPTSEKVVQVKDFFDDYASKFNSIYQENQKSFVQRTLDKTWRKSMFQRFKRIGEIISETGSNTVLDAGCGPGWHDVLFAKSLDVHITGIDIAPKMIEIAKQQTAENGVSEKCDFIVGNLLEHKFDKKFDIVFALGVVEYFEHPGELIKIMGEHANKKVMFSLPVKNHWLTPQRVVRYKMRNCPLWFYTEKEISDLLTKNGFNNFEIERLSRDYLVIINV